jgi:hypothetical protein
MKNVAAMSGRRVSLAREGGLNFILQKRYYLREVENAEKYENNFLELRRAVCSHTQRTNVIMNGEREEIDLR